MPEKTIKIQFEVPYETKEKFEAAYRYLMIDKNKAITEAMVLFTDKYIQGVSHGEND